MIPVNDAPHDLEVRDVPRSLSFAQRRARDNCNQIEPCPSFRASTTFTRSVSMNAASRSPLPPILPRATNDPTHRSDGYLWTRHTFAPSEYASLHQQRHASKVCSADACRKSSCTANFPQYLSTRIDPEELQVESPSYFYLDCSTLFARVEIFEAANVPKLCQYLPTITTKIDASLRSGVTPSLGSVIRK